MTSVTVLPKVSVFPTEFVVRDKWDISGVSERESPPTDASGYGADKARWEDIEELFSSHLERFDSLYRRLA